MSQNSSPIPDSPTGSGEGLPAAFSEGGDVILFESYLYKIPKSLLMVSGNLASRRPAAQGMLCGV